MSITGQDMSYRDICQKAAHDPIYFQNFRSITAYMRAIGVPDPKPFARYIETQASQEIREKLNDFNQLEKIGLPNTQYFSGIGTFSFGTLRYIVIADQIKKMFKLPECPKIVEIGAGFGGQCYIFSRLSPKFTYYIYDLPEVEALIQKVIQALETNNVFYLPISSELPENVDLLISNYAFSECDRNMQLEYFEKVIKKAKRGFMIYNQTPKHIFGVESLSPSEFIGLLEKNQMNPKVEKEPISTFKNNLLITWEK
jgi:hypothetical protein